MGHARTVQSNPAHPYPALVLPGSASVSMTMQRWNSLQNRVYEAGVGVKQKMSKLRPGRQARRVAGDNLRDLKFSWLTV